ncbi:hypothetical protein WN944_005924 [Citrus x changshan-huyou]|uniref:Uncharacterized protein n=1 Tax=Citrus x changshan-huyou TaxID=2935761 RepID=A0AAP0MKQ6_9ROSI
MDPNPNSTSSLLTRKKKEGNKNLHQSDYELGYDSSQAPYVTATDDEFCAVGCRRRWVRLDELGASGFGKSKAGFFGESRPPRVIRGHDDDGFHIDHGCQARR